MAIYKDEVIIIRSRDLGDYDKIFTLFGRRKGKFNAVAKGVRRSTSRKSGHLQTFNRVKVACATGRSLDIVTEAESIKEIDPKSLDGDKFERVGFIGYVLNNFLSEDIVESNIYSRTVNFLESDLTEEDTRVLILNILEELGFSGEKQRNLSYEKVKLYVEKVLDRA